MNIIVKYERTDIFGKKVYTEDQLLNAGAEDAKRAFAFLKKEYSAAVEIDVDGQATICLWDSITDFENGAITVRHYTNWNEYDETQTSFAKARSKVMKGVA